VDVEHNDDPHNRWLRSFIIDTTQDLQRGSGALSL
jgi:LysR family transcriptional activator of mexEF-oprN operon